ncbi:MarR family transcriptional regulator [Bdellovibrio sp. ZAP7]|nr:MarR family transcriptional regulator [Bdellovibrio sp. ZAP7]
MKISKYLEHSPVFAINSAYEATIPYMNKRLKKEDVNLLQGLVLTALFFEGRSDLSPSSLAEQFKTSRGNMSHILSHLEYKGWVKRVLDPKDARKFFIELKPEGKKKALTLIKVYDQIQNHFEKELGSAACQKAASMILKLADTGATIF